MFLGEIYFPHLNSPPVDRCIWWWCNEHAVYYKMVQKVNKSSVGLLCWWLHQSAHYKKDMWIQQKWGNWFWKT